MERKDKRNVDFSICSDYSINFDDLGKINDLRKRKLNKRNFTAGTLASVVSLFTMGCGMETSVQEIDNPQNETKVVYGYPVNHQEVPFIVGLTLGEEGTDIFCTGSLYETDTIVTAAHCVAGIKPQWAAYGTRNTNESDIDCLYPISGMEYHGDYNPFGYQAIQQAMVNGDNDVPPGYDTHDIAVIVLEEPIPYASTIKILDVESYDKKLKEWDEEKLCGFGRDENWIAGKLNCGEVPLRKIFGSDLVFGANYPDKTGKHPGACYGDSGGPTTTMDVNGNPIELISTTSRLPYEAPEVSCEYGYVGAGVGPHISWMKETQNRLRKERDARRSNGEIIEKPYENGVCSTGNENSSEKPILLDESVRGNCSVSNIGKGKSNETGSWNLTMLMLLGLYLKRKISKRKMFTKNV